MACVRVVVVGLALKLAKAGQGRQADRLSVGRFVNPKAEPPVWSSAQELSAAAAAATALSVRPTQPTTSSKPAAVSQPAIQSFSPLPGTEPNSDQRNYLVASAQEYQFSEEDISTVPYLSPQSVLQHPLLRLYCVFGDECFGSAFCVWKIIEIVGRVQ